MREQVGTGKRVWHLARNALFATSLALNGYGLYTYHQTRQAFTHSSLRYIAALKESGTRLYRDFEGNAQLQQDLQDFLGAWTAYENHRDEVDRDLRKLERRLDPLLGIRPLTRSAGQPARDTP